MHKTLRARQTLRVYPNSEIWLLGRGQVSDAWSLSLRQHRMSIRHVCGVILLLAATCITGCRPGPAVTAEPTRTQVSPTSTFRPTQFQTGTPTSELSPEPDETRLLPTATREAQTVTPEEREAMTPTPGPSEQPTDQGPLLRMVYIRARSSREVEQLRRMPMVDVVAVRPDPGRPPGGELDLGGFIVEAVVPRGELAKLKAMGFEISESPPKN